MDKAIQKFIKYLDEINQSSLIAAVIDGYDNHFLTTSSKAYSAIQKIENMGREVTIAHQLKRVLATPDEEWGKYREVFNDFPILNRFMSSAKLNVNESFEVIMAYISKNLLTGFLKEDAKIIDGRDILNHHFKNLTAEEAHTILNTKEFHRLCDMEDNELTGEEILKRDELIDFALQHQVDQTLPIKCNRLLKEHYLDKKDSFDLEDIKVILDTLLTLGVDSALVENIGILLTRKYNKRCLQEQHPIIPMKVEYTSKNYITDEEYRQARKKIKEYYDYYHVETIRYLTEEEKIYCAALMLVIGLKKEDIERFYSLQERDYPEIYHNLFDAYRAYYERAQYYKDKCDNEEIISTINSYIQELFIATDEDYSFWREEIRYLVNRLAKRLPEKYDYEINQAEELKRKLYFH